jgi:hypothetical protein
MRHFRQQCRAAGLTLVTLRAPSRMGMAQHGNPLPKLIIDVATGQAEDRALSAERSESGAKGGRVRAGYLTATQRWRKKT